jgi:hypothetical protein
MPAYASAAVAFGLRQDIAAIQFADSVVAESGPLADGKSPRFVMYQALGQIQA